jgi:hypothetical protein
MEESEIFELALPKKESALKKRAEDASVREAAVRREEQVAERRRLALVSKESILAKREDEAAAREKKLVADEKGLTDRELAVAVLLIKKAAELPTTSVDEDKDFAAALNGIEYAYAFISRVREHRYGCRRGFRRFCHNDST